MHRRDAREAGAGKKIITKDGGTGDWTEGEMEVHYLHGFLYFFSFLPICVSDTQTHICFCFFKLSSSLQYILCINNFSMYVTVVGLSYRLVICLLIPSFAITRILRKTNGSWLETNSTNDTDDTYWITLMVRMSLKTSRFSATLWRVLASLFLSPCSTLYLNDEVIFL